jgi:hypothetical protein
MACSNDECQPITPTITRHRWVKRCYTPNDRECDTCQYNRCDGVAVLNHCDSGCCGTIYAYECDKCLARR